MIQLKKSNLNGLLFLYKAYFSNEAKYTLFVIFFFQIKMQIPVILTTQFLYFGEHQ